MNTIDKNKKKEEITYAFIDSQNVNLGVSSKDWKLDWGKFRLFLRNKYGVSKAFLFIGYLENNTDLYKHLQEVGFILIFKNVLSIAQKNGETKHKGNVDAELVLHAMLNYKKYDKAVVATGDGDFFCLLEFLEKQGKLKKIITPNRRYSSLLRKYSKYIMDLYTLREKLHYKDKKERHSRGKQG